MAELSIIELFVYGLVGYGGLIGLIVSAFRDSPSDKSQSTIRSIWIIAPIICMYMLASAGAVIDFTYTVETTLNYNVTSNTLVSNSTTITDDTITLVQPVWVTLHYLFFIMLIIYFIWNMLQLFTKVE